MKPYRRLLLLLLFTALGLIFTSRPFWRQFYPFPYRPLIRTEARADRVDPRLVAAVIKVESGFNPWAVSQKGAVGLMQVMPATAAWIARVNGWRLNPGSLADPATNIRLGTWYLGYLFRQFHDLNLVLAAYNGGRTNVLRWRAGRSLGTGRDISRIPFPETRRFVRKVLLAYRFYRWLYGP